MRHAVCQSTAIMVVMYPISFWTHPCSEVHGHWAEPMPICKGECITWVYSVYVILLATVTGLGMVTGEQTEPTECRHTLNLPEREAMFHLNFCIWSWRKTMILYCHYHVTTYMAWDGNQIAMDKKKLCKCWLSLIWIYVRNLGLWTVLDFSKGKLI